MVTSLVVFSFFIKPEKYNQCDKDSRPFKPTCDRNTQILKLFSFGNIEYSADFAEMHRKPIHQDAEYIRVIKQQTGLVENTEPENINVLFFLVRNDKKHLREFGDYIASLWEENGIPYKLKSGQYRLQFRNVIGIRPSVLKSIGFSKTDKKSNLWVYTGGEKAMKEDNWDDMDEVEVEGISEEDCEEEETKKSKKNKKAKKAESKKDKDKKGTKDKKNKKDKKKKKNDDVEDDEIDDIFGGDEEEEEEDAPKPRGRKKGGKEGKKDKDKKDESESKRGKRNKEEKQESGMSLKDKLAEVTQNISKHVRSEVKDGVVLVAKADLAKSLKEDITDRQMKQIADALLEKYHVSFDKAKGEIHVWKKAKRVPATLLKVK